MSDTLATLQQALVPKTGMQRIPFPLESYEHPSLPLSAKRLVNLMGEQQPHDARTAAALVSTPALQIVTSLAGSFGAGPILAMNDDFPGLIYIVSGTHFYRLEFPVGGTGAGVVQDLGDVGTPDPSTGVPYTFVTIAVGVNAAVVVVPPNAFTCGHQITDTLNQIGGDVFPTWGASSVTYCDGYFAFSAFGNSAMWFLARLLDPTDFDALDFVFSDAVPNVIRRLITHRGQIWTIGDAGFEVWYDSGDADFPFRRASGGVVRIGTASPMSVCIADLSVWWLGFDGVVYRSNGYVPQRVSTHAIEAIIGNDSVGLQALTHPYRGHWFYCLTVPSRSRTVVFDVTTGAWHERSTSTDGSLPWQASVVAVNNSIRLLGDRASATLYTLEMAAKEAGLDVIRLATLPPLWAGTKRAFCSRVEIEMEVGDATDVGVATPGTVLVEWSDDGGLTWGPSRTLFSGAVGDFRERLCTTRLGSFRQRVFRITTHGLTRLYAVDADIVAGAH